MNLLARFSDDVKADGGPLMLGWESTSENNVKNPDEAEFPAHCREGVITENDPFTLSHEF